MGSKEYEVEAILDMKIKYKKRHYLIKWKGYSVEESTWEPEAHLNCPAIISMYTSRNDTLKIPPKRKNIILSSSESSSDDDEFSHIMSPPYPSCDSPPPMSPSRFSKPKGIAQFFKSSNNANAVVESGNNFLGSSSDSGLTFNSSSDSEDVDDSIDDFDDAMSKFQKMLSVIPGPPISIKNDIDRTPPPSHFTYITEAIYSPEVVKPDPSFLVGCSCYIMDEKGSKDLEKGGHDHGTDDEDIGCCSSLMDCQCISQNFDGCSAYDDCGLLLPNTSVIYECNKKCCCSIFNQPCKNRVIQLGRQASLTIVRLPDQRGWGVIANHDIPRGSFIDLYIGEIISTKEATRRFVSNCNENSEIGSYLFDLDFNYDFGTECEFTLDAYRYGNVSHFFNHSCSPNLKVFPCFIEHLDPRLHSIAFFASKPIKKGDQLTFDYMGLQGQTLESKSNSKDRSKRAKKAEVTATPDRERRSQNEPIKCLCGSSNCRKFIYINN